MGYQVDNDKIYVWEFGAVAKIVTTSGSITELDPTGYGGVQIQSSALLGINLHGATPPVYEIPIAEDETIFRRLVIQNGSDSDLSTITIKHNSGSVDVEKRFYTVSGLDLSLPRNALATFGYVMSPTFSGWRQG